MSAECVVCGSSENIHTHHINGNENDNRPENRIPLCSMHHRDVHEDGLNHLKDDLVLQFKKQLPEKEPKEVECHNCSYSWETESVRDKVTCPSCARKTEANDHE